MLVAFPLWAVIEIARSLERKAKLERAHFFKVRSDRIIVWVPKFSFFYFDTFLFALLTRVSLR